MLSKLQDFFHEYKQIIIPITAQFVLFFLNFLIGSTSPRGWGTDEIQMFHMSIISSLVIFILSFLGYDKLWYWFAGTVLYFMLTQIAFFLGWFVIIIRPQWIGPPNGSEFNVRFGWPIMFFVVQLCAWCAVKIIKWIYRKIKEW